MSEWKTYKLSELVEIKYGKDHKHLADGKIPLYGSGGIMRYVDTPLYEQESILIPRKGTLSNLFYLNIPFWSVDTMFYTKIKEGNNGKYLYYLLKSMDLASMNVGSAVPSLTTEVLNKVEINVPDEATQQEIAQILTSLDDKIELNLQMNETLEAMAQTLFKEWFVNFNFPNFDGVMENGLPKGWRMGMLNEIINFIVDNRGKTPITLIEKENNYPLIEVNSLINSRVVTQQHLAKKYVDEETYNNWFRKGHPQKGDVLFSTVGSIGEIALVFDEKFCIAQNIIALRSIFSGSFLFFTLKNIKQSLLSLDISSVQPSIKVPHLLKSEILIPTSEIIKSYEKSILPIVEKINENSIQIQTLTQTRDALLPKLMSGKIELKN
jgi:type I restriction enzyme S subunit